jgi:hypothetical protein
MLPAAPSCAFAAVVGNAAQCCRELGRLRLRRSFALFGGVSKAAAAGLRKRHWQLCELITVGTTEDWEDYGAYMKLYELPFALVACSSGDTATTPVLACSSSAGGYSQVDLRRYAHASPGAGPVPHPEMTASCIPTMCLR